MKLKDFDFRIWNGEYFVNDQFYTLYQYKKSIEFLKSLHQEAVSPYIKQAEIELNSGVLDCYRKPIYEGDIVSYKEKRNYVVEYIDGAFLLVLPLSDEIKSIETQRKKVIELYSLAENDNLDCIRVIGNIHENGHLLE